MSTAARGAAGALAHRQAIDRQAVVKRVPFSREDLFVSKRGLTFEVQPGLTEAQRSEVRNIVTQPYPPEGYGGHFVGNLYVLGSTE